MRLSLTIYILTLWILNIGDACPLSSREENHSPDLRARDHTFWRRVRIGGGPGGDNTAQQISDIFTVGDASTPGGCSGQMTLVNQWLKEAILLQDAIVKAYSNYKTDGGLRKTWEFVFGIEFEDNNVDNDDDLTKQLWSVIGKRIAGVTQFLEKANSVKPWIFCSDKAGTLQSWDQPIKDKNNKEIPSKTVDGKVEDYYTLKQVFPAQFSIANHKAFFMEAFNGYDFYQIQGDTICADTRRFATTSLFRDHANGNPLVPEVDIAPATRHIVFCPPTFDPNENRQHSLRSLADGISSDFYAPIGGDWNRPQPAMEHYLPASGTFFHELYHLTDTGDTADPYKESMIEIYNAGKKQAKNNANNPESYLYRAMATYLYLNPPQGKDAVLFPAGNPKKASEVK